MNLAIERSSRHVDIEVESEQKAALTDGDWHSDPPPGQPGAILHAYEQLAPAISHTHLSHFPFCFLPVRERPFAGRNNGWLCRKSAPPAAAATGARAQRSASWP